MPAYLPQSIDDLWVLLADMPHAHIMSGGTDLLVRLRAQGAPLTDIVCLERIATLRSVASTDSYIRIGAGVTLSALLTHGLVTANLPVLCQAVNTLGSPLIRNMGTIGGNLCTASPAGDTLPALYAMEASVELSSAQGIRMLPVDQFILGPGKTALHTAEIVTAIHVPIPAGYTLHHFEKVGQREALSIAIVNLAALLELQQGIIQKARLAWGSIGPTVVRSPAAEAVLVGQKLTLTTLRKAAAIAQESMAPINDVRATAAYRKQVAGNLLLRLAAL